MSIQTSIGVKKLRSFKMELASRTYTGLTGLILWIHFSTILVDGAVVFPNAVKDEVLFEPIVKDSELQYEGRKEVPTNEALGQVQVPEADGVQLLELGQLAAKVTESAAGSGDEKAVVRGKRCGGCGGYGGGYRGNCGGGRDRPRYRGRYSSSRGRDYSRGRGRDRGRGRGDRGTGGRYRGRYSDSDVSRSEYERRRSRYRNRNRDDDRGRDRERDRDDKDRDRDKQREDDRNEKKPEKKNHSSSESKGD